MSEIIPDLALENPSSIDQQEIHSLNESLKQIQGVSTELQVPKGIFAVALLLLHMAASAVEPVGVIAGGALAVHEVAKRIHEFIHKKDERYDVTLRKKGKRIELKNLTVEQMERLFRE